MPARVVSIDDGCDGCGRDGGIGVMLLRPDGVLLAVLCSGCMLDAGSRLARYGNAGEPPAGPARGRGPSEKV